MNKLHHHEPCFVLCQDAHGSRSDKFGEVRDVKSNYQTIPNIGGDHLQLISRLIFVGTVCARPRPNPYDPPLSRTTCRRPSNIFCFPSLTSGGLCRAQESVGGQELERVVRHHVSSGPLETSK